MKGKYIVICKIREGRFGDDDGLVELENGW